MTEERRDFETAETWYLKALAIKEKLGDEHGAADTYHQLGSVALERRDFDTAASTFIRCVSTFLMPSGVLVPSIVTPLHAIVVVPEAHPARPMACLDLIERDLPPRTERHTCRSPQDARQTRSKRPASSRPPRPARARHETPACGACRARARPRSARVAVTRGIVEFPRGALGRCLLVLALAAAWHGVGRHGAQRVMGLGAGALLVVAIVVLLVSGAEEGSLERTSARRPAKGASSPWSWRPARTSSSSCATRWTVAQTRWPWPAARVRRPSSHDRDSALGRISSAPPNS